MKNHYCPENGCLYCMVNELYEKIERLKADNLTLAEMNIKLDREKKVFQDAYTQLWEKLEKND